MIKIVFLVLSDPDGFIATAIGHSIFTQAATMDELQAMLRDAVRCHFGESDRRPQIIRLRVTRNGEPYEEEFEV